MHHQEPPKDNPLAVASLALGVISLTGASLLAAIPAIITGVMSLKNPVNKGFGIAGIVMGIISIIVTLLVILFFIFLIGASVLMTPESDDSSNPRDDTDYTPSAQQRA